MCTLFAHMGKILMEESSPRVNANNVLAGLNVVGGVWIELGKVRGDGQLCGDSGNR